MLFIFSLFTEKGGDKQSGVGAASVGALIRLEHEQGLDGGPKRSKSPDLLWLGEGSLNRVTPC